MGKPTTAQKRQWNAKNYDYIQLVVPKGKKEEIKEEATARGQSVNKFILDAVQKQMPQKVIITAEKEEKPVQAFTSSVAKTANK